MVDNVATRDSKVVCFKLPKLGAFLVVPVNYQSCLHEGCSADPGNPFKNPVSYPQPLLKSLDALIATSLFPARHLPRPVPRYDGHGHALLARGCGGSHQVGRSPWPRAGAVGEPVVRPGGPVARVADGGQLRVWPWPCLFCCSAPVCLFGRVCVCMFVCVLCVCVCWLYVCVCGGSGCIWLKVFA
jgi:hypothetical protein